MEGVTDNVIDALRISYQTAPREGWIEVPRRKFALRIWSHLPEDVRAAAMNGTAASEAVTLANSLRLDPSMRNMGRALDLLQSAAEKGDPYAMEELGQIYLTGEGVKADPAKGQEYLERSIAAGRVGAQIKLGDALVKGKLLPKDTVFGLKLLEEAATKDHWGKFVLAEHLLSDKTLKNFSRALGLLRSAADSGNPYALEMLGQIYLNGDGVAADSKLAREYLERAMAAGSIGAQVKLGEALIRGKGLPKDPAEGLKLIETAALTNQWGQLSLGNMLLSGELPRDVSRALKLLHSAADSGNAYALERLAHVYLAGEGVPADPKRGQEYRERASALQQ